MKVAVLDYGVKYNILNCLVRAGRICSCTSCLHSVKRLKEFNPDGYFISNGPGDPAAMPYAVETMKEILKEEKPTFWNLSWSSVTRIGK